MSNSRRLSLRGSLTTYLSSINSLGSLTQLAPKPPKPSKAAAHAVLVNHSTTPTHGWETYYRLCTNCSEFGLVVAFLTTIFVLYYTGLWHRQTTSGHAPTPENWTTIGTGCTLTPLGFAGCATSELALVPPVVWTAIGHALATHSSSFVAPLKMSTCVMGATRGYGAIVLVLGRDAFPACIPSARDVDSAPMSMMAMLETATDDAAATPAYLLSILDDEASPPYKVEDDTSGAASTSVATHVTKFLISDQGTARPAPANQTNWRVHSHPLGSRYSLTYACSSEFVQSKTSDGHAGLVSKTSWVVGWTCRHTVANWMEIAACQVGIIAILMYWGFLLGKPVVTYDFMSGLERRKRTVVLLILSRVVTLMYIEVTRLYVGSRMGDALFVMSSFMLAGLFIGMVYSAILTVQRLPCPPAWRFKAIRVQGPLFMAGTLVVSAMASSVSDMRRKYHDPIWTTRTSPLAVHLPGTSAPFATGTFTTMEVTPVLAMLAPSVLNTVGFMLAVAVVVPILYHREVFIDLTFLKRNGFLHDVIDLTFLKRNGFLHDVFVPSYVTTLPLYASDCIRYGSSVVIKPSTLALLGYAMIQEHKKRRRSLVQVLPKATKDESHHTLFVVVDVADLLPCLLLAWMPWTPTIVGTVKKYAYTKAPPRTKLPRGKTYIPTKGSCVS